MKTDLLSITYLVIIPDKLKNLLWVHLIFKDRIPKNCIAIGSDPGGNLILLSIKGPDFGYVYFWDHERKADEGEEPTYSNLTLIAKSFTEFMENLQPAPDEMV